MPASTKEFYWDEFKVFHMYLFSCYHCTLDKILLMYLCELTAILLGCCMYIESPFKCGESVRV